MNNEIEHLQDLFDKATSDADRYFLAEKISKEQSDYNREIKRKSDKQIILDHTRQETEKWLNERTLAYKKDKVKVLLNMLETQLKVTQEYINCPWEDQKEKLDWYCEHYELFLKRINMTFIEKVKHFIKKTI